MASSAPPPPGPPWDLPSREAPLAFVDLEMTGLDVAARSRRRGLHRARRRRRARRARVSTLVDPGERVGGAAHVHGIDAAELAGAPRSRRSPHEVLAALEGAILVAHAAAWDVGFLAAECRARGLALEVDHWLDTLVLARRAFAFPSYSLDALCRELAIDRGRAHRAESDVARDARRLRAMRRACSRRRARATSGRCVSVSVAPDRPSSCLRGRREARLAGRRHLPRRAPAARAALDGPARSPLRPRPAGRCGVSAPGARPATTSGRSHPAHRARVRRGPHRENQLDAS